MTHPYLWVFQGTQTREKHPLATTNSPLKHLPLYRHIRLGSSWTQAIASWFTTREVQTRQLLLKKRLEVKFSTETVSLHASFNMKLPYLKLHISLDVRGVLHRPSTRFTCAMQNSSNRPTYSTEKPTPPGAHDVFCLHPAPLTHYSKKSTPATR